VKEEAGMYEFAQGKSIWKHKGSQQQQQQQHRAGAQSKHRAGGETATSVTTFNTAHNTLQQSTAKHSRCLSQTYFLFCFKTSL